MIKGRLYLALTERWVKLLISLLESSSQNAAGNWHETELRHARLCNGLQGFALLHFLV